MAFTQPVFLLLLLLLPLYAWIALPRLLLRARGARKSTIDGGALAALGVRSLLLCCLIFALAGMQAVRTSEKLAVVFLVDASDSIDGVARSAALDWVRNALADMRSNGAEGPDGADEAAVVVFGRDAQVARALSSARDLAAPDVQIRRGGTDVEGALRLGLSLLPEGAGRRIILLSDGRQTTGDAASAARLLRTANAQLDAVRLPSFNGPDAAIENIEAPQRVAVDNAIPLRVTVRSNSPQRAQLSVFAGDRLIERRTVNLLIGRNDFQLRARTNVPGFTALRAQVTAANDARPQNDALSAAVLVEGPPRLLIVRAVRTEADESASLRSALQAAGYLVDSETASAMPSEAATLAAYRSVLLVNVPARELSQRAMLALQSYVRNVGGGLVVVGGPNSYGVGGYFRTPLEETLPVEVQIKDPRRFPSLSIVIVLDKSGSMSTIENGVPKMRLAAEAAARVAELVKDEDEVTVIGFDTEPVDVIGPFPGVDRVRFIPQILKLAPGGGGIYAYESLLEAQRVTQRSTRPNRFVILLADGSDVERQEGVLEMVQRMQRDENTTLTVVAIGDGPDVPFLEGLAEAGRGRFHLTDQATNLPTIFSEEAAIAQRSYIVEEEFTPARGVDSPILAGIDAVPPLFGYIAVSEKEAAQVVLRATGGDPLLASWQYGLGRVAAFTSDATGRWARAWVPWQNFARFWAQTTQWTILERPESTMTVDLQPRGEVTLLTAELPDDFAAADATITAAFTDRDGRTFTQTLRQATPNRYETEVDLQPASAYFVHVAGAPSIADVLLPYVAPYSPEYALTSGDEFALRGWAELGGGQLLTNPTQAWQRGAPIVAARSDLFPTLLVIAALLLPFDIAVRRVGGQLREMLRRRQKRREPTQPTMRTAPPLEPRPVPAVVVRITPPRPPSVTPAAPSTTITPRGAENAGAVASDLLKRREQRQRR